MLKTALMGLEILNPNIDNSEKFILGYHTDYYAELKHKDDKWQLFTMKANGNCHYFQFKQKVGEYFEDFCKFYFNRDNHTIEDVVFYL
jgi:hypothetical protein